MDIAVEAVYCPQVLGHPDKTFHSIIRITYHTATEKQSFYIIAPVEFHGQVHKLTDRKSGPRKIIAATVDAIGTIIDAIVGKHHLEQRDATPVLGKAMANAPSAYDIAQHARLVGAHCTAGSTRDVILRRLRQYLQFIEHIFIHILAPNVAIILLTTKKDHQSW
ncbi:conserved domain protein [Bacteroides fluxus YIT 12057]|uniref:Conserved domain protein n=1 Tax=Bacteroides fluxus YIT 12057 TaxID=763034 RepID=F3PSM4_9BACE|nr:conserved domain protein [Bacteroides fluxus YIT 12057]